MEELKSDFPFRLLRYHKYLTLEVLMNVEHQEVLKYIFKVNRATRSYLENKFIAIRNGFINAGLITY
jgi:hypothetical protein